MLYDFKNEDKPKDPIEQILGTLKDCLLYTSDAADE